jgi:hypothetical protein
MRFTIVAAALAAILSGCGGGDPLTPEQEIGAALEAFKLAAHERNVSAATELFSDEYGDTAGRDSATIKAVVRQYFMSHEAIHILYRVRRLELSEPPEAGHVTLAAAVTGAPVSEVVELESLNADFFTFDLKVAREDDGRWRIRSVQWKQASMADMF